MSDNARREPGEAEHTDALRTGVPRVLVVTWTPPGDRNVGEVILRDLLGLLPADRVRVCEISRFEPNRRLYSHTQIQAPAEGPWRPVRGPLGALANYVWVRTWFRHRCLQVIPRIRRFAAEQQCDVVLLTLSSQVLTVLGARLARVLGMPMLSVVWDPPDSLARLKGWDKWSRRWIEARFGDAVRASRRVMVVSTEMVEEYGRKFGAQCTVVRHAISSDLVARRRADSAVRRIGFAGTLYDTSQLDLLVGVLNETGWKIGGRPVVLRMVGNHYRFRSLTAPAHIELMGWRSTRETTELLSECDVTYLPVSFASHFAELARLAFPTKLSTFLAAGRPVLIHGPADAAPVAFCAKWQFGVCCTSMEASALRSALEGMLADASAYAACARQAAATCEAEFSRRAMTAGFAHFIGVDAALLGGAPS